MVSFQDSQFWLIAKFVLTVKLVPTFDFDNFNLSFASALKIFLFHSILSTSHNFPTHGRVKKRGGELIFWKLFLKKKI